MLKNFLHTFIFIFVPMLATSGCSSHPTKNDERAQTKDYVHLSGMLEKKGQIKFLRNPNTIQKCFAKNMAHRLVFGDLAEY